jgi:hypothetical protein
MHVKILAIEQQMMLDTKKTQNFLRIELPNYEQVVLAVSEEVAVQVLKAKEEAPQIDAIQEQLQHPSPVHTLGGAVPFGGDVVEPPDQMVNWLELDDDAVPPMVKAEFLQRGYKRVMSLAEVTRQTFEILRRNPEPTPRAPAPAPNVLIDEETGVPSI